jgi:rsbT co-antagonist protein RsbR
VELVVDVVLDSIPDYRPDTIMRLALADEAVPSARRLTLRDMLHGLSIVRQQFLACARQAVEARASGAWEGLTLVCRVTDDVTAAFANRFHSALASAHDARKASEERYRGLYQRTPAMLHSIDKDGRLVEVSDRWIETLGYTREEVLGKKSIDFLTEESRRRAVEVLMPEFYRRGYCRDYAYQAVKKNGEIIDIRLSAIVEKDAEGNRMRGLAVLVDVTEQVHAQEALRDAEEAVHRSAMQAELLRVQEETLRALSTPLIPVSDRVVVMPLIGRIDRQRAGQIMEALLHGVARHQAAVAILDVTGVPEADEHVADALIRATGAVRLLGAQVVLTGIQPAMAQTLVQLGADLGGMVTVATLEAGIAYAMGR